MYQVACPWCGEPTDTFPDEASAGEQDYIEDCVVCCRPIRFVVRWSDEDEQHEVQARPA